MQWLNVHSKWLSRTIWFILIVGIQIQLNVAQNVVKYTNIKCVTFDKSFADMKRCRLTVPQRNQIALNVHVKLYQLPVTNVSINLSLWKKVNGYRPFLYNYTVDFCWFLKHRSSMPFLKMFFDAFQQNSNINHTCPFDHDIIIKDMILQPEYFRYLPLPTGDYMFFLKVAAYNDWKADVKAYISLNEVENLHPAGSTKTKKIPNI